MSAAAPTRRRSAGRRYPLVDSLRGLAAVSVIAFHLGYDFPIATHGWWFYVSQNAPASPTTGVVLFFLISGFVLYRPFVAARLEGRPVPSIRSYAIRRFARIVPAFWVALAIVIAWYHESAILTVLGVVRYFGFLQIYASRAVANQGISVAWSLDVEMTFYILLPILALVFRRALAGRFSLRAELALFAVFGLVSVVWQVVIWKTVPTADVLLPLLMLPGVLDLFACGMALAVLSVLLEHGELRSHRAVRLLERHASLLWIPALLILFGTYHTGSLRDHYVAFWLVTDQAKALACLLLLTPAVVGQGGPLRRVLGARPLVWLGTVSYGIYLWHLPLTYKLLPHLRSDGRLVMLLVTTAGATLLGALSFHLVENPSQRLARRFVRRRPSRAASLEPRSLVS